MIELAPIAVAPTTVPNDMPPDKIATRAEEPEPEPEKPVEKIELAPAPQPEVTLPPPPEKVEKPVEKPKQKKKMVARVPSPAPQPADHVAAPLPGVFSRNSNAESEWNARVIAQIERHKRASSTERGVVQVAFSVDRSGGVHRARVLSSSGSGVLDRDALALLERSQPLPPPPPEIPGSQISKVLPVRYNMR
jgi:protein TonB